MPGRASVLATCARSCTILTWGSMKLVLFIAAVQTHYSGENATEAGHFSITASMNG